MGNSHPHVHSKASTQAARNFWHNSDILFRLGQFLPLQSFLSISQTCQTLHKAISSPTPSWIPLFHRYFPFSSLDASLMVPTSPISECLRKLSVNENIAGKISISTFYIVHMDGNYWKLIPSNDQSVFPKIAYLSSVCWGEFRGEIPHVKPGKYSVIWRMKWHTRDYLKVENPSYTFSNGEKELGNFQVDYRKCLKGAECDRWFLWNMGTIEVDELCTVTVCYRGDCNRWFGGWYVDWVSLSPEGAWMVSNLKKDEIIFETKR